MKSGESLIDIELKVKGKNIDNNYQENSSLQSKSSNLEFSIKSDILAFLDLIHSKFGKLWASHDFKSKYKDHYFESASSLFLDFVNEKIDVFEFTTADIFREFYFRFFDNSDFKEIKEKINNWEDTNPIDLVFESYSGKDLEEILILIEELKVDGVDFEEFTPQETFEHHINIGIDKILQKLNIKFPTTYFLDQNKSKEFEIKKEAWKKSDFGNYSFEKVFEEGIENGIKELKRLLTDVEHLSSFRANTERIYSSNSGVVEINNLIWEFSQSEPEKWNWVRNFLITSLKMFEIGDDIQIKSYQGVVSEIFVKKGGREILLADLGYGYSQLIPIILKISLIAINKLNEDYFSSRLRPSLFLLEEPEANLHPSLQSKLADFLVLAAKEFNIQFIVETHSEYMIRNFQYLTAKKDLNPWDTQIYYFNHPESDEFSKEPVKEIDILVDGRLSKEFGEGFFDEIPRLLAFLYNSSSN